MRSAVISFMVVALLSCRTQRAKPAAEDTLAKDDIVAQLRRSEEAAVARSNERGCERAVPIYEGSIDVDARDYTHPVADLDRVVSRSATVRFTLDYPFERPYEGVVTSPITLRRTIDAIRAGFRKMYEGTTQKDIPGMMNKDVSGAYGRAFHVIGDLVIESIELCADDTLSIEIGS